MADDTTLLEQAPVQDRDLLQRMSAYFDAIDIRLRQGQGWFIFNAPGTRAQRISWFIERRLAEHTPPVRACYMPWRDFALSAFVNEVGLPGLEAASDPAAPASRTRRELALARSITDTTMQRMQHADLLVLTGLKPSAWHEATFLDQTIERRYEQRLATILLTPEMPSALEDEFRQVDPTSTFWERLFQRMYETSLVAL